MGKINEGTLVAKVRSTKKGQTMRTNHAGREMGGIGKDGRKFYEIRKQAVGRWTCSCLSYRFKAGEVGQKSPCKHMLKLFVDFKKNQIDFDEIHLIKASEL